MSIETDQTSLNAAPNPQTLQFTSPKKVSRWWAIPGGLVALIAAGALANLVTNIPQAARVNFNNVETSSCRSRASETVCGGLRISGQVSTVTINEGGCHLGDVDVEMHFGGRTLRFKRAGDKSMEVEENGERRVVENGGDVDRILMEALAPCDIVQSVEIK